MHFIGDRRGIVSLAKRIAVARSDCRYDISMRDEYRRFVIGARDIECAYQYARSESRTTRHPFRSTAPRYTSDIFLPPTCTFRIRACKFSSFPLTHRRTFDDTYARTYIRFVSSAEGVTTGIVFLHPKGCRSAVEETTVSVIYRERGKLVGKSAEGEIQDRSDARASRHPPVDGGTCSETGRSWLLARVCA